MRKKAKAYKVSVPDLSSWQAKEVFKPGTFQAGKPLGSIPAKY
jgi:hypothetical protein